MKVESIVVADLKGIVAVHEDAFPGYFLTHLGRQVVRAYYEAYIGVCGAVALAGMSEGRAVAFAVGGRAEACQTVRDVFYRKNVCVTICGVLKGLLCCDSIVWSGLWMRLCHITAAVRAILSKATTEACKTEMTCPDEDVAVGRLVSIAVRRDKQGSGIALKIIAAFEDAARCQGIKRLLLCVFKNNARGIAFYKKAGWSVAEERTDEYVMEKWL